MVISSIPITSATIALANKQALPPPIQPTCYTMLSTAYLISSVHIRACPEQHPDRLRMPFLAGNVEGSSPILQHIPTETGHGLLCRSATPLHHTTTMALVEVFCAIHPQPMPFYTMPSTTCLGGSVHISACLEQHPDRLYLPNIARTMEGGAPTLQHIPIKTSCTLMPLFLVTPATMALTDIIFPHPDATIAIIHHAFDRLP